MDKRYEVMVGIHGYRQFERTTSDTLVCLNCSKQLSLCPSQGDYLHNINEHLSKSAKCKRAAKEKHTQPVITSFFAKENSQWLGNSKKAHSFTPTMACEGLIGTISVKNKRSNVTTTYHISTLHGHQNPSLYYYDRFYKEDCIRSIDCRRITQSTTSVCLEGRHLKKNKLFLMALNRKKAMATQLFTNDKYSSYSLLCRRLKRLRLKNYNLKLANHTITKKVVSLTKVNQTHYCYGRSCVPEWSEIYTLQSKLSV